MADALSGRPQNVPYDITARQANIAQKKKLAELMAAQSMKDVPTLTDAGAYKINNWGGQAAKAISQGFAASNLRDARAEEEATAKDYNERLGTGTESFLKGVQGYTEPAKQDLPGPSQDLLRDEGGYNVPEQKVAPNPIRAVAEAMASGMGPLQQMAQPYATAMAKGTQSLSPKEFLEFTKDLTVPARVALSSHMGLPFTAEMLDPKSSYHAQGDIGVTEKAGVPVATTVINPHEAPGPIPGTPGYVGQKSASGKFDEFHGPTSPSQAGETEWEKLGAKGQMTDLESRKATIDKWQETYPRLIQTAGLVRDAFTGTGAEIQLKATKLLQKFGMTPKEGVPATEQLMSVLGEDVMQHTKPLGTGNGFTDKDLKYTQDYRLADISKDPKALVTSAAINIAGGLNMQEQQARMWEKVPDSRKKTIPHLSPVMNTPLPKETIDEYQLYKDPATEKWTTHLTDGYKPGSLGAGGGGGQPVGAGLPPSEEEEYQRLKKKYGR